MLHHEPRLCVLDHFDSAFCQRPLETEVMYDDALFSVESETRGKEVKSSKKAAPVLVVAGWLVEEERPHSETRVTQLLRASHLPGDLPLDPHSTVRRDPEFQRGRIRGLTAL